MSRMIRKQIYLRPQQDASLKHMVNETGLSEAELIREAVEYRISTAGTGLKKDVSAWETEKLFIEARRRDYHRRHPQSGARSWKRDELYERR